MELVGLRALLRARRSQILLGASLRAPRALVLGQPREPPFQPALQSVDRITAKLDRFPDAGIRFRAAAGPARLPPGDDRDLRRVQSGLPVLDSHRSNRSHAALVRSGDEHAQSPSRAPCHQPALSRSQLCGRFHRLGQAVRHVRARGARREDPLWDRQAVGQLQPAVVGVSRMDRYCSGHVARTVEAQAVLPPARAGMDA